MIAIEPIAPAEPVAVPAKPRRRTKVELLETVSASRLNTWLACRLKFRFRYVDGLVKPNTAARHTGTVVHAVLQQWNLARWRRVPLDTDAVEALFEQAWALPDDLNIAWDNDAPEAAAKAAALGLVEMYFRDTPIPPDEKPEAVEVSVEMDLSSHGLPRLIGIIDLVRAGGRIVDFKTTGKTPDNAMALHSNGLQLTAYALLYRDATGRKESAMELHHLIKTKTPKLVITERGLATEQEEARFYRLVESYVHGLESEDYVPSPGLHCAGCEFFNECRGWH